MGGRERDGEERSREKLRDEEDEKRDKGRGGRSDTCKNGVEMWRDGGRKVRRNGRRKEGREGG